MLDLNDPEAIRRYIDAADRYFQDLEDPQALFDKPYVPLQGAGYHVARLGYLLSHLKLSRLNLSRLKDAPRQTVVDFGAGMCWLSILLARMGCDVVALDVSSTALKLGEQAFRQAHLRRARSRPRFLVYDGFRFPLPDASVDRIVCYDAMHHVPNKSTVLREMHRVLRPSGRACFAEPGPGHAGAPDSLHDMEQWGVLEDEVDAAALCDLAAEVGFGQSFVVPLVNPADHNMDVAQFRTIHGDARHGALDWHGSDALVVLFKTDGLTDSYFPDRLLAQIEVVAIDSSVDPTENFTATLRATNVGDTHWIALPTDAQPRNNGAGAVTRALFRRRVQTLDYDRAFLQKTIVPGRYRNTRPVAYYRQYLEQNGLRGMVTLGVQLRDLRTAAVIDRDYARGFLPSDLAPGETCEVQVRMRAPRQPGLYTLEFDMVDELMAWFGAEGSATELEYVSVRGTETPRDSRSPGRLQAGLQVVERRAPGVLVLSIENRGDTIWLRGPLALGGHVEVGAQRLDANGRVEEQDWVRVSLPHSVLPNETALVLLDLSPTTRHRTVEAVKIDMVAQRRCWFEEVGSKPLHVSLL